MQGQQRMDRLTGVGLFVTQLIELSDEGAQLLNVTTAGCPDVGQGAEVRPMKLIAIPWQQGDRSGVSFKADAIEHATACRPARARPRERPHRSPVARSERCSG